LGGTQLESTRLGERAKKIVILGGGPAGCATALGLLSEGFAATDLLLVEASDFDSSRVGESIPPDTRRLFAQLGVLDAFLLQGHEPCLGSASSWGTEQLGYNDFLFNPQGNGWHLDRRRFDAWLCDEVARRGVTVKRGLRFTDAVSLGNRASLGSHANTANGGFELTLGRGETTRERVTTRFVVDATGIRGAFARRMGAHRRELDRLVSVAAFFDLGPDSRFAKLTLLEAVEYGWWYTALLPNRRVATAVATSPELSRSLQLQRPDVWLSHLSRTNHVAQVLRDCSLVADSHSVHLAPSFLLDRMWGPGWLAVGDAASAFDPLSSQGIYKALSSGLLASKTLAAHFAAPERRALAEYQTTVERQFTDYAQQRTYFYDQERRWRDAPFWQQRRRAVPLDAARETAPLV
jgi:flavin-dependent dehydrogenase